VPPITTLQARLKRAVSAKTAGLAWRSGKRREFRAAITGRSPEFFHEIGYEPFLIAKDVVLSGAAKATADLLALDHDGSMIVVLFDEQKGASLLDRGITCAGILAGWTPDTFFQRLSESSSGKLAGFLTVQHSAINTSQRIVLVAGRFSKATLCAVAWLSRQQSIHISCRRKVVARSRTGTTISFEEVIPPAISSLKQRATPRSVVDTILPRLPKLLPAERLGWVGLATAALLLVSLGSATLPEPKSAVISDGLATTAIPAPLPPVIQGQVSDVATGSAIAGVKLYYAGRQLTADAEGRFAITRRAGEDTILAKAAGYRQAQFTILEANAAFRLESLEVRALYLSYDNLPTPNRRDRVLDLISETGSNAIVVGVKDASGYLSLPVDHELPRQVGAFDRQRMPDLAAMVRDWKSRGLYTIALVVLFKDGLLADSLPHHALRSLESKSVIRDQYGIAWVDPASQAVQEYNRAAIEAAAEAGFDEIQLDFVRYPAEAASREGLTPAESRRRLAVVSAFVAETADLLAPYNVYLGAAVFGSVCWMQDVPMIGQDLERFAASVDYVSPMLYPSYFGPNDEPPAPMRNPYQVVSHSLSAATKRLEGNSKVLRPWLQNFPHERKSQVPLRAEQIREQVKAAQDSQASGWMLWDGGNQYRNTLEALRGLANSAADGPAKKVAD
jgi:hypothetical protein